jgi:hypothetical protein
LLEVGLLALAAAAAPAQPPAQMQAGSPADFAVAVSSCWNAVGPTGVDLTKLVADGWTAASATGSNGKTIALPIGIYGKSGVNALVMASGNTGDQGICAVVGRLRSIDDAKTVLPAVKQSLLAIDPNVKAASSNGGIVFIDLPRLAMLNATGSKEKPGMRIVVGYEASEKK